MNPAVYPHVPGHKGPHETGREASVYMTPRVGRRRQEVLDQLAHGPATGDEIAERIGRHWFVTRPRLSELKEMGLIVATGNKRPSACGGKTWEARLATPEETAAHIAAKTAEAER